MKGRIGALLDLLLPRFCPLCGRKLFVREEFLCADCIKGLPLSYFWLEEHNPMEERFNLRIQQLLDKEPAGSWECTSGAMALFFYRGEYKKLTQELKYKANLELGEWLGEALGRKLLLCGNYADVDIIIPVPLHIIRYARRGYNQSAIIAKGIVKAFTQELCMQKNLLCRNRRTSSQVHIAPEHKSANVAGAFKVKGEFPIKPRHILLVDDVFTSGSTLAECQHCLRKALAAQFGRYEAARIRISAATLAFVGDM